MRSEKKDRQGCRLRGHDYSQSGDYFSRISPKRGSLAVVVRTYKAAVTTICRQNGIGEFEWQRGYYDYIIRDNDSLTRIRAYIIRNLQRWEMNE